MRYIFIFSFLIFLNNSLLGQNLVYNPDFEIFDTCPDNISQPGYLQLENASGWINPRKLGTSDFFHVCNNAINGLAGVPNNLLGYQYPKNGDGYAGFITFGFGDSNRHYREYIQTELYEPLEQGKAYYLGFYVSWWGYNYAIGKIGAHFSSMDYRDSSYTPIIAQAQVVNENGPIFDSIGWTLIEGVFIANGNERYLTIGNFQDTINFHDTIDPFNLPLVSLQSYYFIDAITCIEIKPAFPNVFTPNQDGLNDSFYPTFNDFTWDQFTVFNRWGKIVYNVKKEIKPWMGEQSDGLICPEGVYFFQVKKGKYSYNGYFTLLR